MSNKTFLHGDLLFMNVSWASGNLQLYENQSGFAVSVIFSIINGIILLMTFIVHKAVYKLLARLPNRAINQIIYPSMVSNKFKRLQNFAKKASNRYLPSLTNVPKGLFKFCKKESYIKLLLWSDKKKKLSYFAWNKYCKMFQLYRWKNIAV